jgi:CPA2 family monovalent cation:H+ antiporter-2/glutathione-regulated potassium-efflux system protein KefB
VLAAVVVVLAVKIVLIWFLARLFGTSNADALRSAVTLPQGGEFGFVLFSAAVASQIMDLAMANILATAIVLTMAATPLLRAGFGRAAQRLSEQGISPDTVSSFENVRPRIIVLGFGRFGQVVAQMLMAEGVELVAIDRDPDRIEAARRYGYSVYYGDATRADILRAAGAETATVIALCINNRQQMSKAIDAIRRAFPNAAIFCRATDRAHVLELMNKGVEFAIRETFESGVAFGRAALEHIGLATERISAVETDVRWRDQERMNQQLEAGEMAGLEMLHKRTPRATEEKEENTE